MSPLEIPSQRFLPRVVITESEYKKKKAVEDFAAFLIKDIFCFVCFSESESTVWAKAIQYKRPPLEGRLCETKCSGGEVFPLPRAVAAFYT